MIYYSYIILILFLYDMTSLDNMNEGIIKFVLENTPYIIIK